MINTLEKTREDFRLRNRFVPSTPTEEWLYAILHEEQTDPIRAERARLMTAKFINGRLGYRDRRQPQCIR